MNFCLIEQNIVKSNTPPTRDSRENRLSFFYADRQKGATSHDETERENGSVKYFSQIGLQALA